MTMLSLFAASLLTVALAQSVPDSADLQRKQGAPAQAEDDVTAPARMVDVPPPPPPAPSSSSQPDESSPAAAQSTRPKVCSQPSWEKLESAVKNSPLNGVVSLKVWLEFDAKGKVNVARLKSSSGDAALDAAVIDWALQIGICPGTPGAGYIPFVFEITGSPPPRK